MVRDNTGVLSRSQVSMANGTKVFGADVTVDTAPGKPSLVMSGGARIGQDFNYTTNPVPPVIPNIDKVMGDVVNDAVPPPFPVVDTAVWQQFVPAPDALGSRVISAATDLAGITELTNVRIKANSNVTLDGVVLNGVVYVETPNAITFGGSTRIRGVIVTDGAAGTAGVDNVITLDDGVRMYGLGEDELDPSGFPITDRIEELKTMGGGLIIAPKAKLVINGGTKTFGGAMIADAVSVANGYKGQVGGALVVLTDVEHGMTMAGGSEITFTAGSGSIPGLTNKPRFKPSPESYEEVVQ